jgi:hypothetical protein
MDNINDLLKTPREIRKIDSALGRCLVHPNAPRYTKGCNAKGRCSECLKAYRRAHYAEVGLTEKQRYDAMVSRAKTRGVPWTLTREEWAELVKKPCVYALGTMATNIRVGLDQKMPGKGYTPENAQPCCPKHNLFKSDMLTHAQALTVIRQCKIPCGNTKGGRPRTGSNVQSA